LLLTVERIFSVGIFDPSLGGDPVLFQHIFWFYSHPAVYIMILPGMGVVSELITCYSRKNIFGYSFIAFSSVAIAVISFIVWAHHMFVAGQGFYSALVFSALTFFVAVPSAIKVFNWTATLYKGSISFDSPMLFTLGFIALFTIGGLTGLFLSTMGSDIHLHDTYFVIAHFHFIMVGGMVMAFMGGLHFWWPKMTGRMYNEAWAKWSAMIIFVGFFLTFTPQFLAGYVGLPRRYAQYPPEFQVYNVLSSAGASILAVGYMFPFTYLFYSLKYGARASANPWGATGLEWQIPSPPTTHNFESTPVVTQGPYEYALRGDEHVV
jgi:cytochrome c oxidase subunit 1